MLHVFTCPDCRTDHSEPAEAHFLLVAVCLDCALAEEMRIARFEVIPVATAA